MTSINGLRADGYAGWMFSLNDWFPKEGAAAYTVASGNLKAADEGYNDVDLSVAKTAEELKSPDMVAVLGDQYRMDADGSINGGYPVLF